jgi:hypothetical protein
VRRNVLIIGCLDRDNKVGVVVGQACRIECARVSKKKKALYRYGAFRFTA